MTQLAPLWRASMQFAREQQRIASPSSIVNPSYLHTYAPDCPFESYRSQVDRIAEPFHRLIVGKIRVPPRRRTFSFDPCAFYARQNSPTMFLRIHFPRSTVEKKVGEGLFLVTIYRSTYYRKSHFPSKLDPMAESDISIVSFVTKQILRRVGGSSSCRDTV